MSRILQAAFAFSVLGITAFVALPADGGIPYLSRSDWGAHSPVAPMRLHRPARITIHHTATLQDSLHSVSEKMRALQKFSQSKGRLGDGTIKPVWADVPYHLYVGLDGVVAEGREMRYVGDSNTPYDPTGHLLVVVEGDFEREELAPAQRNSLRLLIPELARRWNIPPERIAGHRDFTSTTCPGEHLYSELRRLRAGRPNP